MPGENEEAMRVLLMLGQAVLPPAREVLIITMRALARGTGKVAGGTGRIAGRGANHAISHVNGLGRYGLVTEHTLRRDRNDVIKLVNLGKEGALDRGDLSLLSDICRKHRIGFAVFEDPATGYFAIEYKMKDQEALAACIETAIERKLISNADVDNAMRGPAESGVQTSANPNDIQSPSQPKEYPALPAIGLPAVGLPPVGLPPAPENIEYLGESWKFDQNDGMYKRKFTGWDGAVYTAAVSTAGAFRITDPDGRTAKIGHQICEGDDKGVLRDGRADAIVRCHTQIETLKDREAFEGSVRLQQRQGRTKQMGSHEVIRAVNMRDAADRKANRHQIGNQNRPTTHPRTLNKRVKR